MLCSACHADTYPVAPINDFHVKDGDGLRSCSFAGMHVLIRPRSSPYMSIVPAKLQDLRPSPSFTKSSIRGLNLSGEMQDIPGFSKENHDQHNGALFIQYALPRWEQPLARPLSSSHHTPYSAQKGEREREGERERLKWKDRRYKPWWWPPSLTTCWLSWVWVDTWPLKCKLVSRETRLSTSSASHEQQ